MINNRHMTDEDCRLSHDRAYFDCPVRALSAATLKRIAVPLNMRIVFATNAFKGSIDAVFSICSDPQSLAAAMQDTNLPG
jgi:hypothetical protein